MQLFERLAHYRLRPQTNDVEALNTEIESWTDFLINRVPITDLNSSLDAAIEARGSDRFPVAITEILGAWTKMHAPKIDLTKVNQCQFCEEVGNSKCPFHGRRDTSDLEATQIQPVLRIHGVCLSHGPFFAGSVCPEYPACKTMPHKQGFVEMAVNLFGSAECGGEFTGKCGKELTCYRWPDCESYPSCVVEQTAAEITEHENIVADARNSPESETKGSVRSSG